MQSHNRNKYMKINNNFNILETTLRDGNYIVDFQFNSLDTANMALALEIAGIKYIEIGHGLGLGASSKFTAAASKDIEYIKATKEKLNCSKIGMFAIPGIATLDDIKNAADEGLDFIRIGADVKDTKLMRKYVELSKKLGLFTCTNFMKTGSTKPKDFVKYALMAEEYGSEMIYIVDSAGNMLPNELESYIKYLTEKISVPYGFHGHDNLGLANANSLVAFNNNALMVDCTFLGLGRGSGNAATEVMANIIKDKYNKLTHINGNLLLHLANLKIEKLSNLQSSKSDSIVFGLANVHSMYSKKIIDFAEKNELDLYSFVKAIGKINNVECDENILNQAKKSLLDNDDIKTAKNTLFYE